MKAFVDQKIRGFKKRLLNYSYGITYWRESNFKISKVLRVNGKKREIKFLDSSDPSFVYEFTEICLNDCYHLTDLGKHIGEINTIVDIGANQGLFILAARQHFKNALIQCYEPNKGLETVLGYNAASLHAQVFYEAVTRDDCKVDLHFTDSDLHTTAAPAQGGLFIGTSFEKVIERSGGQIDILKLDCEGGEWDILKDTQSWNKIRSVTMEYHLWANRGKTVWDIQNQLNELGFRIIFDNRISDDFGLLAAIRNN